MADNSRILRWNSGVSFRIALPSGKEAALRPHLNIRSELRELMPPGTRARFGCLRNCQCTNLWAALGVLRYGLKLPGIATLAGRDSGSWSKRSPLHWNTGSLTKGPVRLRGSNTDSMIRGDRAAGSFVAPRSPLESMA